MQYDEKYASKMRAAIYSALSYNKKMGGAVIFLLTNRTKNTIIILTELCMTFP